MAKLRKTQKEDWYTTGMSQSVWPQPSNASGLGAWYHSSDYSNMYQSARPVSSAVSRTMSHARGQADYVAASSSSPASEMDRLMRRPPASVHQTANMNTYYSSYVPAPMTETERYWAYRAIVAETKLAEHKGLRTDNLERMKEELRRQSMADLAHKYHEERVLRLERLAIGLISTIILITLVLLFRHQGQSDDKHSKRSFRPHLTIPILSPFTSIVEHEEASLSFRMTAALLITLGILAYGMFRYWLQHRPR
ncbi:uncharacterized protein FOMMEDRAFT_168473 [Fomitiporia mediterranea MF3/22]|uniref:uncharacterized protein n=1 Tax=Fomitiporia mediterranea (strain MF3/22) TaxID=694068 RepID=UPI00044083B8|nr:uncharacterized protein FOMMEDRAFT_168473 [Fomitiporia mediterranea MF3/22]EJD01871.1 hypothetical protein FOMMEDRAFT_168473 [Fomitiporia mediterranea MF3/22]